MPFELPPHWKWLADECVTSWVKSAYSPDPRWKDKPFSQADVGFFSRGILELSELFTESRPDRLRKWSDYFRHPRFRSSYLLYFLPLHGAKFLYAFDRHRPALDGAIRAAQKDNRPLRVLDLGCGPGTASIALTMDLLQRRADYPAVELTLVDQSQPSLDDARGLIEKIAGQFPAADGKIKIEARRLEISSLHDLQTALGLRSGKAPNTAPIFDLVLIGNFFNEERVTSRLAAEPNEASRWIEAIMSATGAGGALIVEPAIRGVSQLLSTMRDSWIEFLSGKGVEGKAKNQALPPEQDEYDGTGLIDEDDVSEAYPGNHDDQERAEDDERGSPRVKHLKQRLEIKKSVVPQFPGGKIPVWGPCLHAGRCPLGYGRDWCHFSIRSGIPGKWFKAFSVKLGSEREWLKFSYLWLASAQHLAPPPQRDIALAVSDPIPPTHEVLICQPGRPYKKRFPGSGGSAKSNSRNANASRVRRGDIVPFVATAGGESRPTPAFKARTGGKRRSPKSGPRRKAN